MAGKPGTAGGYTVQFIPSTHAKDGVENWRVTDRFDDRIATCYYETNARQIVDALNGAPIVRDPASVDMVREHAARLAELSKRNGGPAGAELAGIAAILATAARRLGGDEPPTEGVEVRHEGALDSDPYRVGPFDFAELLRTEREVTDYADLNSDRADMARRRMRLRVFDDVYAAHRMLDAAGVPGGPLTARIGLALMPKVLANNANTLSLETHLKSARAVITGTPMRRTHGSGEPLAEPDSVNVPEVDDVLEVFDRLSGEELFRLFDAVKVLPPNTREARDWNLMDADDVRRMVATCCAIALDAGKLDELGKAARERVEWKADRK